MNDRLLRRWSLVLVLVATLGASLAQADVYNWTDASGRLNVSNVAPPDGVRVTRVIHENPPRVSPGASAARASAQAAEVQALTERVVQLEGEIERAQAPAAPAYRVVAAPIPPPPPVQVNVTVLPQAASAPTYPAAGPYSDCDPLVFGCPPFVYPVGVVTRRDPGFGRFHRSHRQRAGHRMQGLRPAQPPIGSAVMRPAGRSIAQPVGRPMGQPVARPISRPLHR